jgi:cation diffusion facilitator CzcD-associated flavoprotein CzcO
MSGTGVPHIPKEIANALPNELYSHTAEDIDFDLLRGRRIAVVGAATSAFDAASTALESGAGEVHLFSRRPDLPTAAGPGARAFQGLQENYHLLPDADRWHFQFQQHNKGAASPFDSITRATKHPNFFLHFDSCWTDLQEKNDQVSFHDGGEAFAFDHLIVGTGYQYDPRTRPELKKVAHHIALWKDRYTPPKEEESEALGVYPYVGEKYQFLEKEPGKAPWIRHIHAFNMGASLSFGRPVADIPGLRFEVPRLVTAIAGDLLTDDLQSYRRFFQDSPDIAPQKYRKSIWKKKPGAEQSASVTEDFASASAPFREAAVLVR